MLSANLETTLNRALALADEAGQEYATLEHLLLALTEDGGALAVFEACRLDLDRLRGELAELLDGQPVGSSSGAAGGAKPTAGFQRVLQRAVIYVQSHGGEEVTAGHVLVALYGERESAAVHLLKDLEMTRLDAVNFVSHGIAKGDDIAEIHRIHRAERAAGTIVELAGGLDYWIRRSPYFEATRRYGCRHYAVSNHMYQPSGYDHPVAEYWKLVKGATLWDVATERQVEITGRDAAAFAELLTPRDLSKCPVGQARYVVVTTAEGGIVNDPVLLRLAENHFWLSCSDSDLLLWAKGVAVNAGLAVELGEPDVSPVQLQGPNSGLVIEALLGAEVAGLEYYHLREVELDGIPLVVTRSGWSGELGYELFLRDAAFGETLWERVLEAGRPHGIAVTGPSDIRRVEAGILSYGADMGLDTNPFEVGLDRLVDLDKQAGFIGKAALRRIAGEGVARRLVGIEILGAPLPAPFEARWPVLHEDARVGEVTVAVHSPRLEKNIGYAMLPVALGALGTKVTVEAPWGAAVAVVAQKPFVKASR